MANAALSVPPSDADKRYKACDALTEYLPERYRGVSHGEERMRDDPDLTHAHVAVR